MSKEPWIAEESRIAVEMRWLGCSNRAIATALGRSEVAVASHFRWLARNEESKRPGTPAARRCQVCKKTFTPKQLGILYCSPACRTRSYTYFLHF